MKHFFKRLLLLLVLAPLLGLAWIFAWPRLQIDLAAMIQDPATMKLMTINDSYVRPALISTSLQSGLINLPSGEIVKYWYKPHRLSRFDFSDGSKEYVKQGFCCEVQLPEEKINKKEDLIRYLHSIDGQSP